MRKTRPHQRAALAAALLLCTATLPVAQQGPDITGEVRERGFTRIPLALPLFPTVAAGDLAARTAGSIHEVIWEDLAFSGYFDLVDRSLYRLVPDYSERDVRFREWLSIGAHAVFLGKLDARGANLEVEGRLYDTANDPSQGGGQLILGKRYRGEEDLARRIAHKLAADVVRSMTGTDGIFLSKIAFSSQTGRRNKEIFVMDYDGHRPVQITRNGSLNLSPAWSPDGSQLAYVTYVNGHPEIHLVNADGTRSRVFAREGDLNSSPEWSPDGTSMVYSVSRGGNTELVTINLGNNRISRITNHPAIDTSPAYSPNGREIAFTSDRSGSPQIYIMDRDGSNVRRVTRTGGYNDSAAWSPQGGILAYVSRIGGRFQIMVTDISTGRTRQLTRQGNNENPRFSPDGRHLTFSSDRSGTYQIYTVGIAGGEERRLTRLGSSESPDWSS